MTLPCCWVGIDQRGRRVECDSRRYYESPMCRKHLYSTIGFAIESGSISDSLLRDLFRNSAVRLELASELARASHQHDERVAKRKAAHADYVVYYVRLTGDRIKIGWTANLDQRLRSYRARACDLLAIEYGGQPVEAQRHRQFAAERIGRTEEFEMSKRLADHIAQLQTI